MALNSGILVSALASRPIADFPPDVWGDRFLRDVPDQSQLEKEKELHVIQELVEQIKMLLLPKSNKITMQQLQLVDSIQRLGLEYLFESKIEEALTTLFETYENADCLVDYNSIHKASLSFRLLRQHGYRVSCNIFYKFKDAQGKFKDSITIDVKGMLEFYEAAHLSIRGEDILDEGLDFTRSHLSKLLGFSNVKHNTALVERIAHALRQPYRRGLTRLEARANISMYEKDIFHNKALLRLAKSDYNRLQILHRAELAEICRWWKGLNVPENLPFARDRVVEGYFWNLGVYFEPKYTAARVIQSKGMSIISIIDDMYDAYGTVEELKVFTEAIERWSYNCVDELPDYMKICYRALLQHHEEIEKEMIEQGKRYRVFYAKEAIKILTRAYFEEATWRENNYVPTFNEYMDVALRSSGYRTLIIKSYLGMGDVATKEHFQWAIEDPLSIRASSIICRLKNDIVGHEFEKKRKHIASSVDCYMKDHNVTKQEAIDKLRKKIEEAWKDLNECFLCPTEVPIPLILRVMNFARVMEVLYKEGDWYTHVGPEMQSYIKQLLVDPIPFESDAATS